jgi:hypothetical protein
MHDPRFPVAERAGDIDIEISVLSPLKITDINEIECWQA